MKVIIISASTFPSASSGPVYVTGAALEAALYALKRRLVPINDPKITSD